MLARATKLLGRPRTVLERARQMLGRPRTNFSTCSTHCGRYGAPYISFAWDIVNKNLQEDGNIISGRKGLNYKYIDETFLDNYLKSLKSKTGAVIY